MKITPISHINFHNVSMHNSHNNMKLVDDMAYPTTKDMYHITTVDYYDSVDINFSKYDSDVTESSEEIAINPRHLYVLNMFTHPESRNLGMGTTMHLINIIEMLENDIPFIELDSTAEAVTYHAKMGFKSDEAWHNGLKGILKDIKVSDPEFIDEVDALLKSDISFVEKNKLGNKIVDKYISKSIKIFSSEELRYYLDFYMHMKLTKDDVINNKDFYNKLFVKHNIDYKID